MIPKPIKLYSNGYSEGGAYSVWMARCYQQKDCSIKYRLDTTIFNYVKAAGLNGVYDLEIMQSFLMRQVATDSDDNFYKIHSTTLATLGKPGLSSLAVNAYTFYTLGNPADFEKYTNEKFFNMSEIFFN